MRTLVLRRDLVFYPLIMAVWAAFILVRFTGYTYFGSPLPSVGGAVSISDAINKTQQTQKSIEELRKGLEEETEPEQRGHIQHNIGTAYYDQYKVTQRRDYLDSAMGYYQSSVATLPTQARFHYNLGRIFTERREHLHAKGYYEQAIKLDSTHVLALHNLALLNFYELGSRDVARRLLSRALNIRPELPICNYVLGEIALQDKRYDDALRDFRQEISNSALGNSGDKAIPVSSSATRFAVSKSHLELAILYSTKFIDNAQAQANLHAYLSMEPDEGRRTAAVEEMKKYWVVKNK